jgi:DNA-binding CsgD family transcriptional regulator
MDRPLSAADPLRAMPGIASPVATRHSSSGADANIHAVGAPAPRVGRRQEFAAVREALTTSDEVAGAVLIGDAGVGKTTLARMAVNSLEGIKVQWVAATESARAVPLGAFADLIVPSALRDPVTFLSAARNSLVSQGPIVLGVDDAHLLDQLSATLLHRIAIDRSVRIVVTVRSGEPAPDTITALWKDRYLTRVELGPFTKAESIELVESVIGGKLEGLSADLIWEASGGNALYLHHLIADAVESGVLRRTRNVWQLRGHAGVTSELADLLNARIGVLPKHIQRALRLLSLCEPMDIVVLASLAGDDAVEESEARGLIRVVDDGAQLNARFEHPLFGEVTRQTLGVAAARRLRGEIVTAMHGARVRPGADTLRLAELALGADQPVDTALLVNAAHTAIALSDVALGERFARAAIDHGAVGLAAVDLLARALLWQGRADEVETTLAAFSSDQLTEAELVRWGATRFSNFYFSVGDPTPGDEVLSLLKGRVQAKPLASIVQAISSTRELNWNRLEEAVALGLGVLDDPDAPAFAVAWAAFGTTRALSLMGRGAEVEAIADRLRAVGTRIDGLLRYPAAYGEVQALAFTGRFAEAQDRAAEYVDFSSSGQYLAWGMAKTMHGFVEVATGRFASAIDKLESAVAALVSPSVAAWSFPARTALAEAYSAVGRISDARRTIEDARKWLRPHLALFDPQLRIAEAWTAAADMGSRAGIESAQVAARVAADSGQYAIEAEALHAAARFGDHTVAGRLAELTSIVDGRLVPLYACHAAAVANGVAEDLEQCARDFEELDAALSAADAAAQAATRYLQDGNRARSAVLAAMAHRLAVACGGAVTPALRNTAEYLPLTSREREIANLVAAGLSNVDIAERLCLSARTVEGHIYRACTKLDLSRRDELAAVVQRPPPGA